MKRQVVTSSAIYSIGYDVDKRILEVQTRAKDTWIYRDVPLTTWHFLMASPSKGTFFYQHIKNRFIQQ